jgi:hypothetical protein
MKTTDFNKLVEARIAKIKAVLQRKAVEYAGKDDRLYNLKRAADILRQSPPQALAGMWAKHLVSVLDMIEGKLPATTTMIDEKIGDTINYLILLEALFIEALENDA